jgi:hypothetical protein
MSSDNLEVLDANIVILPEEPLKQNEIVNAMSLFEGKEFASFLQKPLTASQGVSLDLTVGTAVGTFQIESMRSQKSISLSLVRIEVHDRSGKLDFESARIPETMNAVANALHIQAIKAIGANWEAVIELPEGTASSVIANKLLQQNTNILPQGMELIGGGARLYISGPSDITYTLAIEPRAQKPLTNELWMTCNANFNNPAALSIDLLKDMFQQSYRLLFKVQESLFPASQL